MAAKKVSELIKEARTKAGLTQAQLANAVDGDSASDISKAERGEKELSQAALKQIAKATGVTQKSLLEAASGTSATTNKKTTDKKTSDKKTASSSKKDEITLTAKEKKILELYRAADSDTKKAAEKLLKGEKDESLLENILGNLGGASGILSALGKK